ncbi:MULTISPECIES: universal stress protein [Acinetobacter]|uniref:universal stress protein n=1 Tax=Acinetobacter TaxID=469 RepID=UPI000E6AB6DE|nr:MULTISPECIES: universal stress protein [Acinetobacter]MCH2015693.1 universal stress protein [Acinetobacter ursingii]BBF79038.1 universal stress protein family 4 [Acinetobacter ursingii]
MKYEHILVPVDGSDISLAALKQAASIAKAFNSKITAISLLAVDPFSGVDFYYVSPVMKDYFVEAHAQAEETLAKAETIGTELGIEIETQIIKGEVSSEGILQAAEDLKVDLIVMGSHGRKGFQKFFLGSFAQDVLGNTELPVLIVKK